MIQNAMGTEKSMLISQNSRYNKKIMTILHEKAGY